MQSASAKRKPNERTSSSSTDLAQSNVRGTGTDTGVAAGMPAFLQRVSRGNIEGCSIGTDSFAAEKLRLFDQAESPTPIQKKLAIRAEHDPLEYEADQIAQAARTQPSPNQISSSQIKDSNDYTYPYAGIRSTSIANENLLHSTSSNLPPAPAAPAHFPGGEDAPLSSQMRQRVEPLLGFDLGGVRVHAGPQAARSAQAINARAYTHQNHIWLGPSQSPEDVTLIAHETTHVAQQMRGAALGRHWSDGLPVGADDEPMTHHSKRIDIAVSRENPGAHGALPPGSPTSAVTSPVVQRQPDPDHKARANPTSAAQAAALGPPAWTDYFDEVIPAVIEAAESSDKVGLRRAMWLIVQAYGEQSPGVTGRPSGHHNRLFNEQADVTRDEKTKKITGVVPGQEREGVHLYNLKQNESPTRDKKKMLSSPTFGYDTPERAAHHHLEQLQSRWQGAWNALTAEQGSFADFAQKLKASGYAKAKDYDTALIGIEGQVRQQVGKWVQYRLPQMRKQAPAMESYIAFLRDEQGSWQRMAQESDPTGSRQREADRIGALIATAEKDLQELRSRTARIERFAVVLKLKI
jgi:hypothetical protein